MTLQAIDCLGVVLAGGLSSRMGEDKSQLIHQKLSRQKLSHQNKSVNSSVRSEMSMLDFSKQLLSDAGIKNIVISGDNHEIPDCVTQAGPVGGIYSVLAHYLAHSPEHLQPKALLILPVDLPLMTASALAQLRLKGELSNKATFFSDSQNQRHHIPLYLPNNAFLSMFLTQAFCGKKTHTSSKNSSKHSSKNGPSIRSMLENVPHQVISSQNSKILMNTNTPQQWQQAQKQF
ncbi:molybdenum cofactor guanylyltransferase [Colwellia sp. 12G3]|uniref:molybdenum cofactor guanylyltransferase n=1 Tax=Colwellia sp. 12G3 TaxID=2058299 RepID=UPI000C3220BC|nr:NTP transferase domain-containing protein [Colwellia sp. 12G3]PKI13210.1 molybdopterin biosynthesis protein [Colwellia sp. 12G3]